jgi:hypothetical protein
MRRLSFSRPNQKVRNPERHIRSLQKWAADFKGYYPERNSESYINFKLWTLDRLVEGPQSKYEWQQAALQQLMVAAKNLYDAKPESEKGKSWVAILLSYPNLWSSEVTVFFDKEYYEKFRPQASCINSESVLNKYDLKVDRPFSELGYIESWEDEDEDGKIFIFNQERWTIGESAL